MLGKRYTQMSFVILLCLIVCSCKKEKPHVNDYYLLFGNYTTLENGDKGCPSIYRLSHRNISQSEKVYLPQKGVFFNTQVTPLGSYSFFLARDLNYTFITTNTFATDDYPINPGSGASDSLIAYHKNDFEIGVPNTIGNEGYYIECHDKDWHYQWLIDSDHDNIPVYLHVFTDSVISKLNKL